MRGGTFALDEEHSEPFGDPMNIGVKQRTAKLPLRRTDPKEVTQMVTDKKKNSPKTLGKQGPKDSVPEPNKINASTPYDFSGKNLTPYGGLLPVITMLEKLGFQSLVEQTLTSKRIPRAMDLYRFVLGIVLGLYIGFPRLNQLRFIARDPILTGILKVTKLPVQSTFWRFVNARAGEYRARLPLAGRIPQIGRLPAAFSAAAYGASRPHATG